MLTLAAWLALALAAPNRRRALVGCLPVALLAVWAGQPLQGVHAVRYALVQLLAGGAAVWAAGHHREGRTRYLALWCYLLLDRERSLLWAGQDGTLAVALLLPVCACCLAVGRFRVRMAVLALAVLAVLAWDERGLVGWMRPPPGPGERDAWFFPPLEVGAALGAALLAAAGPRPGIALLALVLSQCGWAWDLRPPYPGMVLCRAALEQRAGRPIAQLPLLPVGIGVRPGWLLVSNNPEQVDRPGVLARVATPAGRGRVLASHIVLGWSPPGLVIEAANPGPKAVELAITRRAQASDAAWGDGGTLLWERFQHSTEDFREWLPVGQARRWSLPARPGNSLVMMEVEADGTLQWTVALAARPEALAGPPVARVGSQARGLFPNPDRVLHARVSGACRVPLEGPWLCDEHGQLLSGDYGAITHLSLELDRPAVVLLVARGGLLGTVVVGEPRVIPAGSARVLAVAPAGVWEGEFSLPANSYAPCSLVVLPR